MKSKFILLFTLCVYGSNLLYGQVKSRIYRESLPASIASANRKAQNFIQVLTPAKLGILKKKFETEGQSRENRFAEPVNVDIDFLKQAEVTRNGQTSTYTAAIKAEGALNLSVEFGKFYLPKNAIMKIFTRREITDSITASQNNDLQMWASKVYQGDELFITVEVPAESKVFSLKINKVNIGFKKYGYDFGNVGLSRECNINVVCPEGTGWEAERNSVALIVANGVESCTGALLMNACSENIPYLLTANHCLGAGNVGAWVFQFQTWSTNCGFNTGWIETVQFNGCTQRANNAASDFALLELNTVPAANSGLQYSGWNRTPTGITSTTVIHHPRGDLMKISGDNGAPAAINSNSTDVWQLNLDFGIVQQGSSGAPYFDQNHRVIGQHFRRPDFGTMDECAITVTHGGRFNVSWTGGGTVGTRLSDWLDPGNSGITTTNTTSVASLNTMTMNVPSNRCNSGDFSINNLPSGATVTWAASPASSVSIVPNGNNATIYNGMSPGGYATITATITFAGNCSRTVSNNNIYFGSYPTTATYTGNGSPQQAQGLNYVPPNTLITITPANIGATGSFTKQKLFGNATVTGSNPYNFSLGQYSQQNPGQGTLTLQLSVNTNCGQVVAVYNFTTQGQCGGCRSTFTVSPNPARDNVSVKINADQRSDAAQKSKAQIYKISIFDQSGFLLRSYKYAGIQQANVNVAGLKTGIYTMKIFDGEIEVAERLIITQ